MKVTVITPTTTDRFQMNMRIAGIIGMQDYPDIEFLMDTEPGTIGAKRNRLCKKATGSVILHADSDDVYRTDWVTKSVAALIDNGADIVGLGSCYFHKTTTGEVYLYERTENAQPYVPEATMCYWRKTWERKPFKDTSAGEGMDFLTNNGKVFMHDYKDGFLATIHGGNTQSHNSLILMKKQPQNEAARIIKHFYG
jgi:hypothetical protein